MRLAPILFCSVLAAVGSLPAAAASAWPFWDRYAAHFLSADGRITDPDRGQLTTSEGQSYALFFSVVANDPKSFAKILAWTENNLAHGNLAGNLAAWEWGLNSENQWGILDSNSSSDADLWIAYSLMEAGRLWGRKDYEQKGVALLQRIATEEVQLLPRLGPVLLPGKNGFQHGSQQWVLNPSYVPLPLLAAAGNAVPQGPWKAMAQSLPVWLRQSSPAGFAMDWVACDVNGCSPATGQQNAPGQARGSYDAIRVYLWAGMTAEQVPERAALLKILAPMLAYEKAHAAPPESIAADGTPAATAAPVSFQAALIPFVAAYGRRDEAARLQQHVLAHVSSSTGLLGSPARYYDQNLALFGLGWQQKRFWFAPDGALRVPWSN